MRDTFRLLLGNLDLLNSTCTIPNPPSCTPLLQHSCTQPLGDPAVRINQVVASVPHNNLSSMCAPQDFDGVMTWLGDAIAARVMGE